MRAISLLIFSALMPLAAQAASPEAPVKEIMDVAASRWATDAGGESDYFDAAHLGTYYSKSFVQAYKDASKYPAYDDGSSDPFDYDVITSSQDGCPLKDVKIAAGAETSGVIEVDARFRLWACAPEVETQKQVTLVKFDVVVEDGKPVISDIHRLNEGKWDSLVGEMGEIVKAGQGQQ